MSPIEQVEQQVKENQKRIDRRDQLVRLIDNPDFKAAVTEGFLRDECARYVEQSTDISLTAEDRRDALAMAQAAGYFKQFVNANIRMGDQAAAWNAEAPAYIADLRAEELAAAQDEAVNATVEGSIN